MMKKFQLAFLCDPAVNLNEYRITGFQSTILSAGMMSETALDNILSFFNNPV